MSSFQELMSVCLSVCLSLMSKSFSCNRDQPFWSVLNQREREKQKLPNGKKLLFHISIHVTQTKAGLRKRHDDDQCLFL
jgi:hypothetical protein